MNAVDGTYRLSITLAQAGLAEEQRVKRRRLEDWLDEQSRSEVNSHLAPGNMVVF